MKLSTENLELRGIKNMTSGKGNVYYMVNCEDNEGSPLQFYCRDSKAFPEGLKKGDKVRITLNYSARYKTLVVDRVAKVGA